MKFCETRVSILLILDRGQTYWEQIQLDVPNIVQIDGWVQNFKLMSGLFTSFLRTRINSSSMRLHTITNEIRQQKQHFNLRLSKCYAMSCFLHNALSLRQHYLGLKVVISFRSSVRLKWYQTNTVNGITITIHHKTDWKVSGAGSPCEWH